MWENEINTEMNKEKKVMAIHVLLLKDSNMMVNCWKVKQFCIY